MNNIVFSRQDSIGVNDAADDSDFLKNCFIDLGDINTIEDFRDPHCLVVGRTGVGKTALLSELNLRHADRVITIDAESLAMNYISNSTIVKGLMDLDIDLNTFFKYLWRHVICVEIITKHQKITSEAGHEDFKNRIIAEFKKKNVKHLRALDYLDEWKNSFWKTSESHVAEVTNKLEDDVTASAGAEIGNFNAKIGGVSKFTSEERIKVQKLGQSIVNDMQMREVTNLLDMLNDYIELHQSRYYIVIDKLDEKWVGNSIRYRLIKSLLETIKDLNKFENIKPVATLRYDLVSRVFDATRDTGFQEEKFNSLYMRIKWNKSDLHKLIVKRINHLFHRKYSSKTSLSIEDIFPEYVDGEYIVDYLVDRTLFRPRDLIDFVNKCISHSVDQGGVITESVLKEAEVEYSRGRLESLNYEWAADYPALKSLAKLFRGKKSCFKISDIELAPLEDFALKYVDAPERTDIDGADTILNICTDLINGNLSKEDFRLKVVFILYRVSLFGLREPLFKKINWSHLGNSGISWDDITSDTEINIHKCFTYALGIKD